jgi:hypothetical protein
LQNGSGAERPADRGIPKDDNGLEPEKAARGDPDRQAAVADASSRKKAARGSAKRRSPSPAAQHLQGILGKRWRSYPEVRTAVKGWLAAQGYDKKSVEREWRRIGAFLTGASPRYAKHELLEKFIEKELGEKHIDEFRNAPELRNFAAIWASSNSGNSITHTIRGAYRCYRPAVSLLRSNAESFRIGREEEGVHELKVAWHGDGQPGTFSYLSWTAENEYDGAWDGYVLSNSPFIFLVGFCRRADDVAYFMLRKHPERLYQDRMLVGVQTLQVGQGAVSRPIVAIREEFTEHGFRDHLDVKLAAEQWIEATRKTSGTAVDLSDRRISKS